MIILVMAVLDTLVHLATCAQTSHMPFSLDCPCRRGSWPRAALLALISIELLSQALICAFGCGIRPRAALFMPFSQSCSARLFWVPAEVTSGPEILSKAPFQCLLTWHQAQSGSAHACQPRAAQQGSSWCLQTWHQAQSGSASAREQSQEHLEDVTTLMMEATESCVSFCWELGAGGGPAISTASAPHHVLEGPPFLLGAGRVWGLYHNNQ